jgi:hypothetical protein
VVVVRHGRLLRAPGGPRPVARSAGDGSGRVRGCCVCGRAHQPAARRLVPAGTSTDHARAHHLGSCVRHASRCGTLHDARQPARPT